MGAAGGPLPYVEGFWAVAVVTACAQVAASARRPRAFGRDPPPAFVAFQTAYLAVYLLAVAADWLQGPYVYALYTHYGYEKAHVGQLYIAGFASSAVFGTFVAAVADKYGRRSSALLYCATYILSCATKHSANFYMLLLGRLLGGVAYSILFAAFESWMVYEHSARCFPPALLAGTFAKAQLGNGIVAIASAKIAGWFAARYGKVMPFDVSIAVLIVLAARIAATWTENYGDKARPVHAGFVDACAAIVRDPKILLIGLIQASFEGAMYTFTFVWTPALQGPHNRALAVRAQAASSSAATLAPAAVAFAAAASANGTSLPNVAPAAAQLAPVREPSVAELPHGEIFATFMAATMIGSSVFSLLSRHVQVEKILRVVFAVGVVLYAAIVISPSIEIVYISFVLFEVLCGIYFPAMGTMRAPYLPEQNRSALLTFFRVPLNVIVVLILYEDPPLRDVFILCAGLMLVATISQHALIALSRKQGFDSPSVDSLNLPSSSKDVSSPRTASPLRSNPHGSSPHRTSPRRARSRE